MEQAGAPDARGFSLVGGIVAAAVAGMLVYRLTSIPIWTIGAVVAGGIGGYALADVLARFFAGIAAERLPASTPGAYRRVCPRCGSTNVESYTGPGLFWGQHFVDRCKQCGYGPSGAFGLGAATFPEMTPSTIKEFRAQREPRKHVVQKYGRP
jgi:hypothetical protein